MAKTGTQENAKNRNRNRGNGKKQLTPAELELQAILQHHQQTEPTAGTSAVERKEEAPLEASVEKVDNGNVTEVKDEVAVEVNVTIATITPPEVVELKVAGESAAPAAAKEPVVRIPDLVLPEIDITVVPPVKPAVIQTATSVAKEPEVKKLSEMTGIGAVAVYESVTAALAAMPRAPAPEPKKPRYWRFRGGDK